MPYVFSILEARAIEKAFYSHGLLRTGFHNISPTNDCESSSMEPPISKNIRDVVRIVRSSCASTRSVEGVLTDTLAI